MALASKLRSTLSPGNRELMDGSDTLSLDRTAAGLMLARVLTTHTHTHRYQLISDCKYQHKNNRVGFEVHSQGRVCDSLSSRGRSQLHLDSVKQCGRKKHGSVVELVEH